MLLYKNRCPFVLQFRTFRCLLNFKYTKSLQITGPSGTCRRPAVPINGERIVENNNKFLKVGEAVIFRCDEKYALVGSSRSVCQENGEMSSDIPKCKRGEVI